MGGAVIGGMALTYVSISKLMAADVALPAAPPRKPLVVKPVLSYDTPTRRSQSSWRNWGGIQTQQDAEEEASRIRGELNKLQATADFPMKVLPLSMGRTAEELASAKEEMAAADVVVLYAAGGWALDFVAKTAKDVIFFCRHKSGPVYLWYECISPRYLRQHTDMLTVRGRDDQDVVIDSQEELLWRFRSLGGLKNTLGSRVIAIGGPSGWATPNAPKLAKDVWKLDIQTVSYKELGELIKAARADQSAVEDARRRADEYLNVPGTSLETDRKFVANAFLLEAVFRALMQKAECRALTINGCMGTIMPIAETTACLPISTLNDTGYLIFCESDFVVIPAGILLSSIAGRPFFMNDPTYPHDGVITLAHCTGARKMDGKNLEPARILTHFESDYGAAPKVEMRRGQMTTNIVSDFAAKRFVGVRGEIVDAPFLPICRNQIDIRFQCDSLRLAERMPGFHWMTCYGDCSKEIGYALKRVGIQWEFLG
jgi:L-fucose isomerase-like protein